MTQVKWFVMAAIMVNSAVAVAQEEINQTVIYKWRQNGVVHYAKVPPRNMNGVVKLDKTGLVIDDDDAIAAAYAAGPIRPDSGIKAVSDVEQPKSRTEEDRSPLPEGAISRKERCETANKELMVINNNLTVYQEDSDGNLVPISEEEKAERLAQAQETAKKMCAQ